MTSLRFRSILGSISITALLAASLLLTSASKDLTASSPTYRLDLFANSFSVFNVAVLFAWLSFGAIAGILATAACAIIAVWALLRCAVSGYGALLAEILMASLIGYWCSAIGRREDQLNAIQLEKVEEELNLLSHDTRTKGLYVESLKEKLKGYSVLKEISERFSAVLSLDEINKLIIGYLITALAKRARILLFLADAQKQELMLWASDDTQGGSRPREKRGDVFDYWVLRYRKPLIIDDITKDFRFPGESIEEAKRDFMSLIASPLLSEDRVIGVLRMDSMTGYAFSHDDTRILDIVSNLGAVAVQNAMLYARTQELAIKDGLTGLYLRRYFMERLQEEIKRAARKKRVLAFLMMDIDHFKNYNDRFGHTTGDLILKHLTQLIGSMTRETDILARYGGEEFALLLIGTDSKNAARKAESIRKKIEDDIFAVRGEKIGLTISIGVSYYPEDGLLKEELIKAADDRLYKAKSEGRNKVCAAA